MGKTLDLIIGGTLILVGTGTIVAGLAEKNYTGATVGLGTVAGGYKFFLEKYLR